MTISPKNKVNLLPSASASTSTTGWSTSQLLGADPELDQFLVWTTTSLLIFRITLST